MAPKIDMLKATLVQFKSESIRSDQVHRNAIRHACSESDSNLMIVTDSKIVNLKDGSSKSYSCFTSIDPFGGYAYATDSSVVCWGKTETLSTSKIVLIQ